MGPIRACSAGTNAPVWASQVINAHVGAGDHQHSTILIKIKVIGNERHGKRVFDHGVAPSLDFKNGFVSEPGSGESQTLCAD
jgi:hypothetical protein